MAPPASRTTTQDVRERRVTRAVLTGFLAKAANFLPTLAIASVVVPILGAERFGVLMTILSLMAFLVMADLGVGGGLVTEISRALGRGDLERVRCVQANGFVVVSGMSLVLLALACTAYIGDVGSFLVPKSEAAIQDEAALGLATFGVLFALAMPLTLIGKIQLGLQRGDIANSWQVAAAIVNFGAGAMAALAGLSIPWIIAGLMSGTLLCGLANIGLFYRRAPTMRPSRHDVSRTQMRALLSDSLFYLALQIVSVLTYAADTLIVARNLGAEQASTYALAERLFSSVAVAVAVITAPLWAAYGEALGARDWAWARRALRVNTLRLAAIALVLAGGIALLAEPLVQLLSSGHLVVPLALAVAMGCWRVVEAVGASLSVYMFASRAVRFVLVVGGLTAVVSLAAKVLAVNRVGFVALPWITTGTYLLLVLLPTLYHLRRSQRATP
jgi:O-antigen/teichoic acid export membrane protein